MRDDSEEEDEEKEIERSNRAYSAKKRPTASARNIERPKSIKSSTQQRPPSVGIIKNNKPMSEEEEDDEATNDNQLAHIEGLLKGLVSKNLLSPEEVPFMNSTSYNLSSEEEDDDECGYNDFMNMDLAGTDFENLTYDEFAQLMNLESLSEEPILYVPDLPVIATSSDEGLKNALIRKRWRELLLDKKRNQIKLQTKISGNPGVHRSGYMMYNADDYEGLNTSNEIKELFQYISMYTPPLASSQFDVKLKPFIPEFYPSVGDIDAFIKVSHPDISNDNLGISVLDEPSTFQSDPSVLDLRLRAMAKQNSAKALLVKKVESVSKNGKIIDNWIKDISDLHRSKPSPSIHYSKPMPDIDHLLQEWPQEFEKLLKNIELPSPYLDCDLKTYVDLICNIFDIPIYNSRIQSLHVLATLYLAHKSFGNYSYGQNYQSSNSVDSSGKIGNKSGNDANRTMSGIKRKSPRSSLMLNSSGVDRLELE